jgi:choline-sulfatase
MPGISRREFAKTISTGVLAAAVMGPGAFAGATEQKQRSGKKRPNFVFICSDQHSGRYAGYAGHPYIKTPNLDRIARTGVAFTSAYSGSPLCVPGRSCLMTGMYPSDVNSFCNSTVYDGSHPTWGKRLRDSGYHCWATGKQDLNPAFDLGFTGVEIESGGHAKKPDITSLFRRPVGYRINEREGVDGEFHERGAGGKTDTGGRINSSRDQSAAGYAADFLTKTSGSLDRPWAAFVGFIEPHPPWNGLKEYYDYYLTKVRVPENSIAELEALPLPYQVMRNFKRISTPIPDERIRRAMAAYFGMISELDEYVGQVYDCVERTGQIDNTYFIYTSDHGESLGEHGMWLKNNLYEGPVNVPMIITGPGLPVGKVITSPVSHVDLIATMIQLSGMGTPKELRGTSLLPLINGHPEEGPSFVYSESHSEGNPTGSCMIRKGKWKLIHFSYYNDYLFDLEADPRETNNRIDDPSLQDVVKDLRTILYKHVDPEAITEKAYDAQAKVLNGFVEKMNAEELFQLFKSRLGDGQARVMATMLKKK